jgi:hypothetical protein
MQDATRDRFGGSGDCKVPSDDHASQSHLLALQFCLHLLLALTPFYYNNGCTNVISALTVTTTPDTATASAYLYATAPRGYI